MALPLASGQTGGFYCCFVHSWGHQFSMGACALLGKGGIRVAPLQAEESVQRKSGHRAQRSFLSPCKELWGLHEPPMCISSSCRLFSEAGGLEVLGSIGDFAAPKESLAVSPQQAAASCSMCPLFPSLLGFCAVGFARSQLGLESKALYKACLLV